MLFHSWFFILFAVAVVGLYYAVPVGRENAWGGKFRRILILVASLYFYAVWRPEYLALILATIGVDYMMARLIERFGRSADVKANIKRRIALVISLCFDLGLLFAFKYLGFFEETWNAIVAPWMGKPLNLPKLLLPMGISFYTFQSLSYVIDVYRAKIPACKSIANYALYVTFFPQLIQGPINRFDAMRGQLFEQRSPNAYGMRRGLLRLGYGVFKKTVGDAVIEMCRPIREETDRLLKDKAYLEQVYRSGAEKASYIASKTLRKVYKKVGFIPR